MDPFALNIIKDNSVDSYPWNIVPAFANNLKLRLRPCIQSYASLTPWLDRQNYNFFMSDQAPKFILWTSEISDEFSHFMNSIDDRYLLNDEPQTIKAIFSRYKFIYKTPNIVILELKPNTNFYYNTHEFPRQTVNWDKWLEIKPYLNNFSAHDVLRAKIYIHNSLIGWLKRLIYRNSLIYIDYKFDDNTVKSFRLPIKNAVSGVWIYPFIADFKDNDKINANISLNNLPSYNILQTNIDGFKNNTLFGWWCLSNSQMVNVEIVLKNTQNNTTYFFKSHKISRPDVAKYFSKLKNSVNSGFTSDISDISQGDYQVGILLNCNKQYYLNWTNFKIKFSNDKNSIPNPIFKLKKVSAIRLRNTYSLFFDKKINIEFCQEKNLLPE